MNHRGTVRLETERLVLRRFLAEDITGIFQNCWSDYAVWKWTNYAPMNCVADVREKAGMFTERWLRAYENPKRYSWAIQLKSSGEVIGRLFGMNLDEAVGQIELTYEIGRKWWNQGLMTEAVRTVIDFFIREVGLNRVYAYHAAENPASGRVMQKCGMSCEGVLRQAGKCNCGVIDMVYYAILADEYNAQKKALMDS